MVQVDSLHLLLVDEEDPTAADKASIKQKTVSGLTWVGRRTTSAIASLPVASDLCKVCAGSAGVISLVAAFADLAHLRSLRRLCFSPGHFCACEPALTGFLDWVLEQVPQAETMQLSVGSRHLPSNHTIFQHVRHLEMATRGCQGQLLVARQLPSLETLSLEGNYSTRLEVVDMSGCKRLRHVALYGIATQELIRGPTGSEPCLITLQLDDPYEDVMECCPEALINNAAVAQQVVLGGRSDIDMCVHSMLGAFPSARVLDLAWPVYYKPGVLDGDVSYDDDSDEFEYHADAHQFLTWCMPAGEQRLTSLTEINITAYSMQGTIPSARQLPNLRALLVHAANRLEVGFQDPIATISGLTNLYLFGRPLIPYGWDVPLVAASGALEKRSIVLGTAVAQLHDDSAPAQPTGSCIYLRPAGMPELSIGELFIRADQLLKCRCGACFGCLRRAGLIEG